MNDQIAHIAKQEIERNGFFVALIKMITNTKIQILVDGSSKVDIHLCSHWNRSIRKRIEEEIPMYQEGNFELEVSSFGIGEPLVDTRQYAINVGRLIMVHFVDAQNEMFQLCGRLAEADAESISIEILRGKGKKAIKEVKNINIKYIKKAVIEIEF